MIEEEVLREVRTVKEAFAASHDYDLRRIHDALRKMDAESEVPVVSFAHSQPDSITRSTPAMVPPSIGVPASGPVPSV